MAFDWIRLKSKVPVEQIKEPKNEDETWPFPTEIELDLVSFRDANLRRFKRKCFVCGYHRHPAALQAHHILPRSLGGLNKVSNGVLICANCHRLVHEGLLVIHPNAEGFHWTRRRKKKQ